MQGSYRLLEAVHPTVLSGTRRPPLFLPSREPDRSRRGGSLEEQCVGGGHAGGQGAELSSHPRQGNALTGEVAHPWGSPASPRVAGWRAPFRQLPESRPRTPAGEDGEGRAPVRSAELFREEFALSDKSLAGSLHPWLPCAATALSRCSHGPRCSGQGIAGIGRSPGRTDASGLGWWRQGAPQHPTSQLLINLGAAIGYKQGPYLRMGDCTHQDLLRVST